MTRKEFKENLYSFCKEMLANWDSGRTEVTVERKVAMIDATKPEDQFRRYESGSILITITMKDPREKRPEEFT